MSPRLGVTGRKARPSGGIAARRKLSNIVGVPGLNTKSKLEFITSKADELMKLKSEQEKVSFEYHYKFDYPKKILGQGANGTVCKCYSRSDESCRFPLAVKIIREPDEEKRLAHRKEFDIT